VRGDRHGNALARLAMPSRVALDARRVRIEYLLEECARVVFSGGIVMFPRDTSYGIGCDPFHTESVDRLCAAGGTAILHVATSEEFLEYARETPLALLASKRLLPAPVTLIVRKPDFMGDQVSSGPTLAIRVPDEPIARAILERCGPLAAIGTGSGSSVQPDMSIENGSPRFDRESTVVDLTGRYPRLLREGAVSRERLAAVFGPLELLGAKEPYAK
jgi:L-threonylcarbamoyladenylate synthase